MLGVFKARAVPVNVNFRYTAEELAYLVTDDRDGGVVHRARPRDGGAGGRSPRRPTRSGDRRDGSGVRRAARRRLGRTPCGRRAHRRRPLPALHRRHHGRPQGRDVAPARHLHGQLRWSGNPRPRRPSGHRAGRGRAAGRRRHAGAATLPAVPADARGRGLDRLAVAARRRRGDHRFRRAPRPGCRSAPRRGRRGRPGHGGRRRGGSAAGRRAGRGPCRRPRRPSRCRGSSSSRPVGRSSRRR